MRVTTRIAIQKNNSGILFRQTLFHLAKEPRAGSVRPSSGDRLFRARAQGPETLLVSPHNALLVPCIGAADYRLDCGMRPNRGSRFWIRLHTSSASLSKSAPSLGIRSQWLI